MTEHPVEEMTNMPELVINQMYISYHPHWVDVEEFKGWTETRIYADQLPDTLREDLLAFIHQIEKNILEENKGGLR